MRVEIRIRGTDLETAAAVVQRIRADGRDIGTLTHGNLDVRWETAITGYLDVTCDEIGAGA